MSKNAAYPGVLVCSISTNRSPAMTSRNEVSNQTYKLGSMIQEQDSIASLQIPSLLQGHFFQNSIPLGTLKMSTSQEPPPWHASFPAPRQANPPAVSSAEVLEWFQAGKIPGKDFLLVDLRRTDHEVESASLILE